MKKKMKKINLSFFCIIIFWAISCMDETRIENQNEKRIILNIDSISNCFQAKVDNASTISDSLIVLLEKSNKSISQMNQISVIKQKLSNLEVQIQNDFAEITELGKNGKISNTEYQLIIQNINTSDIQKKTKIISELEAELDN